MVETYGLRHIGLRVADVHRSTRFYREILAAKVSFEEAGRVELLTPGAHDVITLEKGRRPASKGGVTHFGFRLRKAADVDKVAAKLRDAGATWIRRGEFRPGCPYVFARDPDGYQIEIRFE